MAYIDEIINPQHPEILLKNIPISIMDKYQEKQIVSKLEIEAVVVCVGYADFLAHTLPENRSHFDRMIVVTSPTDKETQSVCSRYNVECIQTTAFWDNDAVFNKASGINVGLKALSLRGWVVQLDADIYLPPLTRYILEKMTLNPFKMYGVDRLMCPSYAAWQKFRSELPPINEFWTYTHLNAFPVGSRICKYNESDQWVTIGFLQLWNPLGSGIFKYPMEHTGADRTDVLHAQKFDRGSRELLPEIVVIHLESEKTEMGANWMGRTTKRFEPAPDKSIKIFSFIRKVIRRIQEKKWLFSCRKKFSCRCNKTCRTNNYRRK